MRRSVFPVLLLASALASGCRTPLPPARPLAPTDARPAALLAALTADAQSRQTLRALASLSLDGPAGSGRAKHVLLVARPAQLRVEILGFLDQTAALLVTEGGRYRFFRSEDRSLLEGPVHPELLLDVAGVGLTPEEAVDVLLGAPTPPPGLQLVGGALLGDGTLRIDGVTAGGASRRRFEFDPEARLRHLEVYEADGLLWEASFDDYRPVGGSVFAHRVELRFPRSATRTRLSFRRVELNPELPPDAFVLRLPYLREGGTGGRG